MDSFQKTVVIIAVIILIICLILIGIALHNHNAKAAFPPVVSTCPDYWTVDSSGNCNQPVGGKQCKSKMPKTKNKCRLKKWAEGCQAEGTNLTWDGITNNQQLCKSHHH